MVITSHIEAPYTPIHTHKNILCMLKTFNFVFFRRHYSIDLTYTQFKLTGKEKDFMVGKDDYLVFWSFFFEGWRNQSQ